MTELVLHAYSVGCTVPQFLAGGRIHSVFQRACNLETFDGLLIGLLDPTLPRTPWSFSLSRLPAPFPEILDGGDTFLVSDSPSNDKNPPAQTLFFPQCNVRVELRDAVTWTPRLPAPDHIPDLLPAVRLLEGLRDKCRNCPPGSSGCATLRPGKEDAAVLLRRKLHRATDELAEAARCGNCAAGAEAASALLGLGNGLTPAGDDILIGFLAGLRSVSRFDRTLENFGVSVGRSIAALAPSRTSTISRIFLLHAAQGLFSENVVDLIRAVLNNEPCSCLSATAERLCRFGASSGIDTLTGIVTAWTVRTGFRHPPD